jgi:hypothetical protein
MPKAKGGRNAGLAIFDVKLREKGKHRHMQRKALYSYILKGEKKKKRLYDPYLNFSSHWYKAHSRSIYSISRGFLFAIGIKCLSVQYLKFFIFYTNMDK